MRTTHARQTLRALARRRTLGTPVPPVPLPPGMTVVVPDRGEFFVRDSGGSGPTVLLVHGWMFPSDLNWVRQYDPLVEAGYRVLAVDCRGHGRGLRSSEKFRLADCADDLAGILLVLEAGPALVVGYSMGGPITQLLVQRHPEVVAGFVQCATALNWNDFQQKIAWRAMLALRLLISSAPRTVWNGALRSTSIPPEHRGWVVGELSRGSAVDLAEAGRELGRFDSTTWVASLAPPRQVILTSHDRLVPPRKQADLARALSVEPLVVRGDHDICSREDGVFTEALLLALSTLTGARVAA